MKIILTHAEVEEIVRRHVQATLPGSVKVCKGHAEMYYGRDEYESPEFNGFSFEYEKEKTKYEQARAFVAGLPRDNKIPAIKAFRERFNGEGFETFPRLTDGITKTVVMPSATFGLHYSKLFVEQTWVEIPDEVDF